MICSIVGGGCGVVFGGIFSDILVKRMGIRQVQSLYIFSLSSLFWCLYPINVKTADPIGPKFFEGSRVTPGKVYELSKFKKIHEQIFQNPRNVIKNAKVFVTLGFK